MIVLLGATGYIGQAFGRELHRRGKCYIPLSRRAFDYTRFDLLFDYVRKIRPEFVINAAGHSGMPNIEACEADRMRTFQANTLLPQTVARVCMMTKTPFGHVSSTAIYSGAKIFEEGHMRLEPNLNRPAIRELFLSHPEKFFGFTELDEPNFTFRSGTFNFFAGTKALAEESLRSSKQAYVWRVSVPFDAQDNPRNLLTQLRTCARMHDQLGSLTQLDDYVRACLNLVEYGAAYGVYNVANPGAITTRRVADMLQGIHKSAHHGEFWEDDEESCRAPRSSCISDITKLRRAGVRMRPVEEALRASLEKWEPAPSPQGSVLPLTIPDEPLCAD